MDPRVVHSQDRLTLDHVLLNWTRALTVVGTQDTAGLNVLKIHRLVDQQDVFV
jgi:hypothetical protein